MSNPPLIVSIDGFGFQMPYAVIRSRKQIVRRTQRHFPKSPLAVRPFKIYNAVWPVKIVLGAKGNVSLNVHEQAPMLDRHYVSVALTRRFRLRRNVVWCQTVEQ